MTERITISIPDEMAESIHTELSYGDNRSEWIRDAIREKLNRDEVRNNTSHVTSTETPETSSERIEVPDDVPDRINTEDARAAIRAAIEYVENNGGATMREIVLAVMENHPLGYDYDSDKARIENPDKRNRSTWWRRVIKPGLSKHPSIQKPKPHDSEWIYW